MKQNLRGFKMNFKLALAAAAVVGLAGTAQAADLGKRAPAAANYVKVCDAYGAGFFYIPGSDTCLKIGGYVQAEYNVFWHSKDSAIGGNGIDRLYGGRRLENQISTRARADINLDARTNTEMGLLRSFIELRVNNGSYGNAADTTNVELAKAFVQFGGLTAGRSQSMFDFYTGDYTQNAWLEASHGDSWVNLLAYTFSFGNGVTATLSIEDPSTDSNGLRRADYTASSAGTYGGVKSPDFVGVLAVEQAWGSAQLSGVLHDDFPSNSTIGEKLGYAIQGGVKVNLPALGAADQIALQVAYAKGALGYLTPKPGLTSVEYVDFNNNGAVNQSSGWAISGGFSHGLTKTLTANLDASYLRYYTAKEAATDVDFGQFDLAANVSWAPVKGLAITPEVAYRNVSYTTTARAAGVLKNEDAVITTLRVRRTF